MPATERTQSTRSIPAPNDLDLGLSLALLDDERYAEISDRLGREGFEPDTNDAGNPPFNAGGGAWIN